MLRIKSLPRYFRSASIRKTKVNIQAARLFPPQNRSEEKMLRMQFARNLRARFRTPDEIIERNENKLIHIIAFLEYLAPN